MTWTKYPIATSDPEAMRRLRSLLLAPLLLLALL